MHPYNSILIVHQDGEIHVYLYSSCWCLLSASKICISQTNNTIWRSLA